MFEFAKYLRYGLLTLLFIGCSPAKNEVHLSKINVIVFLGTECPISQQYSLTLQRIKDQYEGNDSLTFTAIFPEKITYSEAEEFLNTYSLAFNSYIDQDLEWTKKLKASVTPEVFILNAKMEILYQGAIDNWYVRLGENRQRITAHFLRDNLMALVNAQNVPYSKTMAVGCIIENIDY